MAPFRYSALAASLLLSSLSVTAFAQNDSLECVVLQAAIQSKLGLHETELHCQEVQADNKKGRIFELSDMPKGLLKAIEKANLEKMNPKANSVLLRTSNIGLGNGKLRFNANSKWSVSSMESEGASQGSDSTADTIAYATQERTVLAVRVEAADDQTSASASTLSNKIFGTTGDGVNLRSQMLSCSLNQVDFVPATGPNIVDGVVTVTLSMNVNGVSDGTVRNAVTTALSEQYGISGRAYDHIMYVLPDSVSMGIAYAYINHYLSVYKNNWGTFPSAQMHEIGHNLGLAHSNEGGASYGDQTGMMGYSYSSDEGPRMCFNGAKSAQLSWYRDKQLTLNAGVDWSGQLTGVVDHNNNDLPNVIKILSANGSNEALYVTLNAKKGFNGGTKEAGNLVTITKKSANDSAYALSDLVAKMSASAVYTENNFGGDNINVTVRVNNIYTTTSGLSYYYADVDVIYDDAPPTASNMNVTTDQDTSLSFDLQGQGGDTLTYSIVSNPSNGAIELNGQQVTYWPDLGFAGTDSFTYQVSSSSGTSNVATVSITVLAPPPAVPTGLSASDAGNGQVSLSWSDVTGETYFQLERQEYKTKGRNASWSGSTLINVQEDAVSFSQSLSNGQYRYRIRSGNPAGVSSWSGWIEVSISSNVDSPKQNRGKK